MFGPDINRQVVAIIAIRSNVIVQQNGIISANTAGNKQSVTFLDNTTFCTAEKIKGKIAGLGQIVVGEKAASGIGKVGCIGLCVAADVVAAGDGDVSG